MAPFTREFIFSLLCLGLFNVVATKSEIDVLSSILKQWPTSPTIRGTKETRFVRQQQGGGGETCTNEELDVMIAELMCGPLSAQVLDIYEECGFNDFALQLLNGCSMNERGEVCNVLRAREDSLVGPSEVEQACALSTTRSNCSQDCQMTIGAFLSDFGCCLNNLYNSSSGFTTEAEATNFDLWSMCGIQSPGYCATDALPPTTVDEVCDVYELSASLFCDEQIRDGYISVAQSCGNTSLVTFFENVCARNDDGRVCFGTVNVTVIVEAQSQCSLTNTTCSSACRDALVSINNQFGCCFNNLFNTSNSLDDVLTDHSHLLQNELWDRCGVPNPGFCDSIFDSDSQEKPIDVIVAAAVSGVAFIFLCIGAAILTLCCCYRMRNTSTGNTDNEKEVNVVMNTNLTYGITDREDNQNNSTNHIYDYPYFEADHMMNNQDISQQNPAYEL